MTVNKVKSFADVLNVIKNAVEGLATVVEESEKREGYIKVKTSDISELASMICDLENEIVWETNRFPNNKHLKVLQEKILSIKYFGNKVINIDK